MFRNKVAVAVLDDLPLPDQDRAANSRIVSGSLDANLLRLRLPRVVGKPLAGDKLVGPAKLLEFSCRRVGGKSRIRGIGFGLE